MNSIPGARAKLEGATEDLFRFSGSPGPTHSIPVDREPSRPPARRSEPAPTSARKPEASIMFSLEELMKASPAGAPSREEEVPNQLWSMQAATPIFGTEQDLALLTAPVKPVQASSMDSMTMPSRKPAARRWLPLAAGGGATLVALAAAAWWTLGSSSAETAAVAPEAVAAAAEPAPAPADPAAAPVPPAAAAPAEPAVPAEPAPAEAAAVDPAAVAEAPSDAKAEGEEEDAKGSKPGSAKGRKKPASRTPASTAAKAAFSTAAAKSALATAAAKAASCKGTSGKGKVQLTFAPTGRVSSAQIVDGPFAGKPAGACALRHFKAARVPAFSGSPQTVAKSFTVP